MFLDHVVEPKQVGLGVFALADVTLPAEELDIVGGIPALVVDPVEMSGVGVGLVYVEADDALAAAVAEVSTSFQPCDGVNLVLIEPKVRLAHRAVLFAAYPRAARKSSASRFLGAHISPAL